MPQHVTARSPGKVNIALLVGPVRPDGYHPLASVFHAVALEEEVSLERAEPGAGIRIGAVEGPQADQVPLDEGNLAWRAVALMAQHVGRPADATIRITKG